MMDYPCIGLRYDSDVEQWFYAVFQWDGWRWASIDWDERGSVTIDYDLLAYLYPDKDFAIGDEIDLPAFGISLLIMDRFWAAQWFIARLNTPTNHLLLIEKLRYNAELRALAHSLHRSERHHDQRYGSIFPDSYTEPTDIPMLPLMAI